MMYELGNSYLELHGHQRSHTVHKYDQSLPDLVENRQGTRGEVPMAPGYALCLRCLREKVRAAKRDYDSTVKIVDGAGATSI